MNWVDLRRTPVPFNVMMTLIILNHHYGSWDWIAYLDNMGFSCRAVTGSSVKRTSSHSHGRVVIKVQPITFNKPSFGHEVKLSQIQYAGMYSIPLGVDYLTAWDPNLLTAVEYRVQIERAVNVTSITWPRVKLTSSPMVWFTLNTTDPNTAGWDSLSFSSHSLQTTQTILSSLTFEELWRDPVDSTLKWDILKTISHLEKLLWWTQLNLIPQFTSIRQMPFQMNAVSVRRAGDSHRLSNKLSHKGTVSFISSIV